MVHSRCLISWNDGFSSCFLKIWYCELLGFTGEMEGRMPMRRTSVFLIFCMFVAMGVIAQNGNKSVVNVGALYTFDSYIGRSIGPALHAAIEDVNADSTVLKDWKINLIFQDTNCSGFVGTVEGISFSCLSFLWTFACLDWMSLLLLLDSFV